MAKSYKGIYKGKLMFGSWKCDTDTPDPGVQQPLMTIFVWKILESLL